MEPACDYERDPERIARGSGPQAGSTGGSLSALDLDAKEDKTQHPAHPNPEDPLANKCLTHNRARAPSERGAMKLTAGNRVPFLVPVLSLSPASSSLTSSTARSSTTARGEPWLTNLTFGLTARLPHHCHKALMKSRKDAETTG